MGKNKRSGHSSAIIVTEEGKIAETSEGYANKYDSSNALVVVAKKKKVNKLYKLILCSVSYVLINAFCKCEL